MSINTKKILCSRSLSLRSPTAGNWRHKHGNDKMWVASQLSTERNRSGMQDYLFLTNPLHKRVYFFLLLLVRCNRNPSCSWNLILQYLIIHVIYSGIQRDTTAMMVLTGMALGRKKECIPFVFLPELDLNQAPTEHCKYNHWWLFVVIHVCMYLFIYLLEQLFLSIKAIVNIFLKYPQESKRKSGKLTTHRQE